jgi:hypothetical protein
VAGVQEGGGELEESVVPPCFFGKVERRHQTYPRCSG